MRCCFGCDIVWYVVQQSDSVESKEGGRRLRWVPIHYKTRSSLDVHNRRPITRRVCMHHLPYSYSAHPQRIAAAAFSISHQPKTVSISSTILNDFHSDYLNAD